MSTKGNPDEMRKMASREAITFITPLLDENSIVGMGSGSTVDVFVKMFKDAGVPHKACVSSSRRTSDSIAQAGLTELPLEDVAAVDIYIDGIDEGNAEGITLKGGAGALSREKVVATLAKTFVTIAGVDRKVEALGKFPVPVEVLPFARAAVTKKLRELGGDPKVREGFVTDCGNILLDVAGLNLKHPEVLEQTLNIIPGVVDNGVFALRRADRMIFSDGIDVFTTDLSSEPSHLDAQ